MGEFAADVVVAFDQQDDATTYSSTLDAITTTISAAQGAVIGVSGVGIKDSGLSFGMERGLSEKAYVGGFTRGLSEFLKAKVPTFTFAWPFAGSKSAASTPPVDADATPWTGVDALLAGCGLVGSAWGSGVGWQYVYGSPNPISALVCVNSHRLELHMCRVSHSIAFTPGQVPICTSTVSVGSVKDHSLLAVPTPDYDTQLSVSSPVAESMGFSWKNSRGFSALTLDLTPTITTIPDSNATDGERQSITDRETKVTATVWEDDSGSDEIFPYTQMTAAAIGTLEQMSFLLGDAMTDGNPAEAVGVIIPDPEVIDFEPDVLDTKAASAVTAVAKSASANAELQINFQ
jgi:hypothetical protein